MMKRLKEEGRAALCFLKNQHRRSTALLLVFCMILTMVPKFALKADAVSNGYVRTTVLNLSSTSLTYQTSTGETATANPTAQDITDTGEGWAWYKNANAEKGYGANTLELNNANINVSTAGGLGGATSAESRAISATISDGLNIVVIGDNNLSSANGQVVANSYVSAMVTYYPLTIKSTTNGTLNLHENATNMSAVVAGGLTTDHVNFNIDCSSQSNSALNSTYSSNNNGAPLVFDGGTATLRGNTGYSNAGLRGSSVSIKGGAVLTCSGEYGINGSSISIEDGMIHSTGNNRAFATNPSLGTGLFAIDNANNVLLPSTTDLTGYKDVVISSQNTDMSVTVNSDTPDEDLAVSAYSGNISIPLTKTDDNQYTGKIASGTYGLKVNGIDTGASFTASSSNNKIDIDVYKLSLAAGTGISGVSGAGYYVAGAKVNIGATANTDSVFSKWTSSNSALAPNMSTANTSVTMPASSMKFTATGITKGSSAVTLNKPVFTNNKSGYTFKSAVISNLTGVKSITFSITNGTTVQSVPTFLTPTSKLESIHGDTRTFTYVFAGGVTVSQAEEFIRGIVFNYVAGAEISVTVDDNATNLPDGAKITKFTPSGDTADHYYMYVENQLTWNDAYNQAKSFRYMGMVGYLATITSQEEDTVLDNISMAGGWSGGSRYTDSSDGTTAPAVNGAKDEYFKWSCGPEHGQNYYQYNAPDSKGPESGAYNGFKDAGEPNNYNTESTPRASGDYEWCMQIHFPSVASSTKYTWNDLSATNTGGIAGYFVEFSNYPGGMDNDYSSSKTATGSYSLAADGSVEEPATVTLNSPSYGSNDSVFSFPNAELKNISTIYSLTIKLDNYTNVLSKPSAPTVTNELTNIAGATNTITYQFESGISPDDAQSFLRGLQFRYGGLTDDSATNVSVTVDGNKTNLPAVASITEFNGHYYMYVDDCLSWTDAYNKAKTYTYMGLVGYLATITSAEEDKVLDNISMNGAWSAGTRHTGSYDLATAPSGTPQNNPYFIWACGPEAGTQYYYNNSTAVNGAYSGFFDKNEPNGSITSPNSECCMQVHYKGNSSSPMTWNDLCDRIYNGSGQEPKVGYFVEFSDYDGGRADGYSQSANGKSTVPISVKKGDVFSTVKNGETYYVDTVLKAYDRNISNITVNNSAFTSGDKLPGNLNTTYTVKASDLDGNTATTTVTMKTIASISEPISGLTVDNVQMSDKDSILAVKAALMAINTTDASADQKTEIANAIQNCKDLYFALFNATASPANGTNGWYKSGMGDITLTAPDGFTVSANPSGAWTGSIAVDSADGADKTATYYLKDTSTGDVSGVKAFNYKVDTAAPSTPVISYGTNNFKELLNALTFGLFFNDTVTVTLSASDTGSGVKGFTYTIGGTEYTSAATAGSTSFDIPAPYKGNISGVKAIDNAGNESAQNATEYFAVDNQTPAAPTVDTNGYTSGTWTKGDVKITVSGASATSGIAKYQYSKGNDATWYDMTTTQENDTTVTEPYNAGKAELTIGTDCNAVNYRFRAVSNAGNCGTPSEATIVGIDKAAPVISSVDGNPSAWTNNDATLTVTAGDSSSGLAAEPYSFDGGESWQASKSKSFASNQTVSIAVKDNAGNISAVTTVDITRIDKAAPVISSVDGNPSAWTNNDATLTVTAGDSSSGLAAEPYSFDGGESWQASRSKSFASNQTVSIAVKDNAGNISAVTITDITKIDKAAPVISSVDGNPSAWTNNNVTLTVTAGDSSSGLAAEPYSFDGGESWQASKSKSFASNQTVSIAVKDNAGNISAVTITDITKIDKAAPVISSVDGNPSSWTNQDVTLTVTAGDSSSGLAAEPYSFDGGESWQASKSKSFASNQTVSIAVKDNAGNISAVTTVDITKIDKAVPSTPSVSYGTNNFKELLNSLTFGLFFNDTVTVTLSASDTGSGVKEFSYTIGGTEYTSAAAGGITSFDIPAPYKGNLSGVKAVDNAGNESAQSATEYFAVDNQAPDAPTVDTNGYASGTWAKSTVTLTASGASATSGIAKYQYSADNGATWSDMTTEDETDATDTSPYNCVDAELAISNDRNGPILLRAVSNSGIKGEAASVSVKRDSVTPKLAVNVTGTVGQWTDTPVTFTLANSANNISPVAYWVKIGSGEWTQLSGNTCNVTGNVNTTYQFKAVSGSGLTSPLSNAYTVKLASDTLKEVIKNIDSLPDPDIASDKQITDNEQLIKDTKILYDTLSRDEQSAVGQSRVDKLNKLISRLNALLVIIPKDTNTGITAGNIGTSVQIPELNNPGVSKVVVRLAVSPVNSSGAQNTNIAIASARLDQTGTNLVAAFDVSLIKSVFDSAGNETDTGKVSNSNIKGPITIRIPVPANYKGRTDLQVVYIDDSGNVTPLTTTLVVVDGVQYLQFTTTHFSVYAVTAPAKTPSTPNPNTGDRSLPMGIMPFFVFAILSVSATILLRRRKKKRGSSK